MCCIKDAYGIPVALYRVPSTAMNHGPTDRLIPQSAACTRYYHTAVSPSFRTTYYCRCDSTCRGHRRATSRVMERRKTHERQRRANVGRGNGGGTSRACFEFNRVPLSRDARRKAWSAWLYDSTPKRCHTKQTSETTIFAFTSLTASVAQSEQNLSHEKQRDY